MADAQTVILQDRFCGPPESANGGYTAGTLARFVDGPAEVTLRRPPPLDRALEVRRESERVVMFDGDELIAEAVATTVDEDAAPPVDLDMAIEASSHSPFRDLARHPFPTCFACGPKREEGDGLRLFAGRVPGTDTFATPWTPSDVTDEIVWAALDCPSSAVIYLDTETPPPHVLGRIAARIDRLPNVGVPHVIMSWSRGTEGRKAFSGSAIYDADRRLCAVARATWIRLA
jgi:hypothetical protein